VDRGVMGRYLKMETCPIFKYMKWTQEKCEIAQKDPSVKCPENCPKRDKNIHQYLTGD